MDELFINQKKQLEFFIGNNRTFLLDGNLIYVVAIGVQTDDIANEYYKIHNELSRKVEGKLNYLIDLNRCKKNLPEARKVWKQISEDSYTNKIALFGMHPVARVLAAFVMGVSANKKRMFFFDTEDKARAWLDE